MPRHGKEDAHIDNDENGVLDNHVERRGNAGINLIHVCADTCQNVSFPLLREEGKRQGENLLVDVHSDVTDDACTQRHQTGRTPEVSSSLQQRQEGQEDTQDEQGSGWSLGLHQLLRVVVAIVLGHIHPLVDAVACPSHQFIPFRVHSEENLQDRYENGEGEDIEQGSQHIHAKRADDISLISGKILAHLLIKLLHFNI